MVSYPSGNVTIYPTGDAAAPQVTLPSGVPIDFSQASVTWADIIANTMDAGSGTSISTAQAAAQRTRFADLAGAASVPYVSHPATPLLPIHLA